MTQINVYLSFGGNCLEAMTFYKECLGGELMLQKVEGSPVEENCTGMEKDGILHAALTNGDLVLMGTDMTDPGGLIKGNNFSASLNCSSEEEINRFFTKLSAGGKVMLPLGKQFWGALFGVFTDRFGIKWMLNFNLAE